MLFLAHLLCASNWFAISYPKACQKAFFRENCLALLLNSWWLLLRIYMLCSWGHFFQYCSDLLIVIVLSELLCASDKNKWDFVFMLFFCVSSLFSFVVSSISLIERNYNTFLLLTWIFERQKRIFICGSTCNNIYSDYDSHYGICSFFKRKLGYNVHSFRISLLGLVLWHNELRCHLRHWHLI